MTPPSRFAQRRATSSQAGVAGMVAILISVGTLYAGIHWGSTTAGGADSYGYITEAGLFLRRQLTIQEDIIRQSPWPNAANTWAPLGYRASPHQRDAIVPLYPPGLPIVMAVAQVVGGFCAAFLVVPLCGALTVWLTFALAEGLFARPVVSLGAAALVATSPVFLYQLMNPMTDVPVTAAWTLALVLSIGGRSAAAGIAAGIAVMIRPNLAPVAMVLLLWLVLTRQNPIRFVIGLTPLIGAVGAINASIYESALVSGYGTLDQVYSWTYWGSNVRQFASWTVATQTPVVILAALSIVISRLFRPSRVRYPRVLLIAFASAVVLSYLFYLPFDAWWYLRFLLPLWPVMMVLTVAAMSAIADRLSRSAATIVVAAATIALAANGVRIATARLAFDVGRGERRYIDVARFIASHTDKNAVVLALQHSGTIRLYAGRLTLRFDQIDPAWLDRVVDFLAATGRHPYIVLEGGERTLFATRFASSTRGLLDSEPMAQLDSAEVRVYDAVNPTAAAPVAISAAASRRTGWRCDPPYAWPPALHIE